MRIGNRTVDQIKDDLNRIVPCADRCKADGSCRQDCIILKVFVLRTYIQCEPNAFNEPRWILSSISVKGSHSQERCVLYGISGPSRERRGTGWVSNGMTLAEVNTQENMEG